MKRGKPELEVETAPTDLEAQAGPEIRGGGNGRVGVGFPPIPGGGGGMARRGQRPRDGRRNSENQPNEFSSRLTRILQSPRLMDAEWIR